MLPQGDGTSRAQYSPIGVVNTDQRTLLLLQNLSQPNNISLGTSINSYNFQYLIHPFSFNQENPELVASVKHFSFGKLSYFLFATKQSDKFNLQLGSLDLDRHINLTPLQSPHENAVIVSEIKHQDQFVMYSGDRAIRIAYSKDLLDWKPLSEPVIIDSSPLEVGDVFKTPDGILLLYFKKQIVDGKTYRSTHLALFDLTNPEKLLWKTTVSLWDQSEHWKNQDSRYLGTSLHKGKLFSYWHVDGKIIYAVVLSGFKFDPRSLHINPRLKLKKHASNPIIVPDPNNEWEAFNTFNPAAVKIEDKVHILYRAQGFDYLSSVGYATSTDGKLIDERFPTPAYSSRLDFEMNKSGSVDKSLVSGGGCGGCEDPRLTLLDGRVYMTYVAFDGWSPPRLALTSILLEDFLDQRWNWTKPVLVSAPGIVDKSGCLLPEKINGKYVFFHRVFPNILIDFIDDLNFDGESGWLKGEHQIKIREDMWDSRKIGVGAPPLKTSEGWLLIYYGVNDKDASKYHIGAMLLDLNDPTKVLYRSNAPILEPSEEYEMNGFKPGIAYPCGAVILNDELLVYYGSADSVVCVASAPLTTFLNELKSQKPPKLTNINIREVIA